MGRRPVDAPSPRREDRGALYEIGPGATSGNYHFHHGAEELLVVLRGRPTLRDPSGERRLVAGDVVYFRVVWGRTARTGSSTARTSPCATSSQATGLLRRRWKYPESQRLSVMALTESQLGAPLWDIGTLDEPQGA